MRQIIRLCVSAAIVYALVGCTAQGTRESGASVLTTVGVKKSATFEVGKDFVREGDELTQEEEYVLGRAVAARILGTYPAVENDAFNQYLNKVGAAVVSHSVRPETFKGYTFTLLNSDEVNAMAAPSGFVFITRGLLRKLKSEDELAAVLAHEVTHVINKDGLKAIKKEHMPEWLPLAEKELCALDCSGLAEQIRKAFGGAVNDVAESLMKKGYSREQEYAADSGAVDILFLAGYNADAFLTVFAALDNDKIDQGGWFATHPSALDRSQNLRGKIVVASLSKENEKRRTVRFSSAARTVL